MLNVSRIFTVVVVLYPVLSMYGVGIASITLSDACLLVLYPFLFFVRVKRKEIFLPFLIFFLYIGFQYIVSCMHEYDSEVLLRTLRYLLYIYTLFFLRHYFIVDYACNVYEKVVLVATYFLFIQFLVFHLLGIYIPGYLPYLPILRTELIDFMSYVGTDGGDIRMRSIFGEPAHYAQYVLGCFLLLMFCKGKRFKLLVLALGIMMSGSSTGICLMFFLLCVKLYQDYSLKRLCIFCAMGVFLLFSFSFIGLNLMDLCKDLFGVNPVAKFTSDNIVQGRLGSYNMFNILNFSLNTWLFGHGMETSFPFYLPGFLMLFWYFGIVGLLIYVVINIYLFFKVCFVARLFIIVFALLNIGTEVALGPYILLYFSFILSLSNCCYKSEYLVCNNYL